MTTIVSTELTTVSCWCGTPMALPKNLVSNAKENGSSLYCPATGHKFSWDSENEKLRKLLDRERSRLTATQDQLRASERQTTALKGQLTKARKRAAAGVCPCCNRSFVQLSRHMKSKHPGFQPEVQ